MLVKNKAQSIVRILIVLIGEIIVLFGLYYIFIGMINNTFHDISISSVVINLADKINEIVSFKHHLSGITILGLIFFLLGMILLSFNRWKSLENAIDYINRSFEIIYVIGFIIIAKRFELSIWAPLLEAVIVCAIIIVIFDGIKANYINKDESTLDGPIQSFEYVLDYHVYLARELIYALTSVVKGQFLAHVIVLLMMWFSSENFYVFNDIWQSADRYVTVVIGYFISSFLLFRYKNITYRESGKKMNILLRFILFITYFIIYPYMFLSCVMNGLPYIFPKNGLVNENNKVYNILSVIFPLLFILVFYYLASILLV